MREFHSLTISDEAQVGAARRAVHRFAERQGFGVDALAELDIVVQEIGTNAVRYATGGGCLHWTTPLGSDAGLEIFYWDKGPGIEDFDRAVRDGVSTGGSLGTGLGAIRRLLDEFDAYSTVRGTTRRLSNTRRTSHGTALLGRKWVAAAAERSPGEARGETLAGRVGAWSRPYKGEDANGDAYFVREHKGSTLYAVIDGLGHGRGAREASDAAVATFEQWAGEPLDELLWAVHDALRATRGAVIGAVVVDRMREIFNYAGVGNVEVRVLGSSEPTRPIPTNGTFGARVSNIRVWPHRWAEGVRLVMASDGLSASWDIASYPGLSTKDPQLLAGILLRDYGRDSDDATILVAR
ncbi:MAG: ATP-binding protein [Acidobacteria bacterium]|nr:ATP-binding protein [Acidobacteriota bacterium]